MGQVFYTAAVRTLTTEPSDAIDEGLMALVRKQFVRPERSDLSATDALGFRHLLIRDAAYGSIPKATRGDLHERFADWLDEMAGSLGERDEIVGYHLEQAYGIVTELGPADDHTRTLARRADRAPGRRRQTGSGAAGRVGDRESPRSSGRPPSARRSPPARYPDGPRVGASRSDLPRADHVLVEAMEGARVLGDQRLEALAGVRLAFVRLMLDPEAQQQAALEEAKRYAELFEGWSDDLGVAEALELVGTIRFWAGRCAMAEEDLERARAHAHRAGSGPQEGEIARMLTLVISQGPTQVEEAIRRLKAMLEQSLADRKMESAVASKRAELEAMLGRSGPARELAARATALARELGDPIALSRSLLDSSRVEMLADSPETAERDARAGYEILDRIKSTGNLASAAPHLGDFLYAQGRYDEAEKLSEFSERITIEGDVDAEVRWRQLRAKTLARRGRHDEAEPLVREAVRIVAPTDYLDLHADALFALAEVMQLAGRSSDAAEALRDALEVCRRKGNLVGAGRAESLLAALGP